MIISSATNNHVIFLRCKNENEHESHLVFLLVFFFVATRLTNICQYVHG